MIQTRTQVFLLDFGFFAHATIVHTERKSYIEKSQWTDTNHQVQYHSHAVHMNDKTTASWLFVSLFFVCYGCYYDYFEPADWAHSEIQNTKPYLYGSPCYTVRLPYFLLTYATYMCGKFCFSKSKLIHVAGYTIYFCIISKTDFHCLLLFVCCILFFFSLTWWI